MNAILLKAAPHVAMIAPRMQKWASRLSAALDAFAEARLRKARLRPLHSCIYVHALVPALVGYPYTLGSTEPALADAAAGRKSAAVRKRQDQES